MIMKSRIVRYSLRLAKGLVLAGCASLIVASKTPDTLEQIKASGKLIVLSQNGPTTYYEDADGRHTGFEYGMLSAFAEELGVQLEIRDVHDLDEMFKRLREPTEGAHLAAAGLTVTPERREQVRFTPSYFEIRQQVIYKIGEDRPRKVSDLEGKKVAVIAGSAHAEELRKLAQRHTDLEWEEISDVDATELLEMVNDGSYQYAIVDSNAYAVHRGLYPNTAIAFNLTQFQPVAWAFPHSDDDSLYRAARRFMLRANTSGLVAQLREEFFGHISKLNAGGAQAFAKSTRERLPQWREAMQKVAEKYDLDWHLLAALSYQESHWNPRAKSPTGVRGLMMLTLDTARELGVNRLNPEQAIDGGARYFIKVRDKIPERIREPDRTWMALAAYNVGYGHLEDARILTEKLGGNPDRWADVREHLPLLAKRQYYKHTKHGYARGWEPVTYVQNIRHYQALLTWSSRIEEQRLAAAAEEAARELADNTAVDMEAAAAAPAF
ncbi:membrane-bound lytic murein transglycosylase MltF [Microbulbifer thermotolerans]|uniref:Membrane-bound lytic murein transglycosylase F n=1 Tax=Microbulbifer thermotolerans TaxID=252514 RepID=A0A143HKV1_MICTH|nr:membrane-bound lytic murein transglycosylase MltF [Microbulbifer thermotolerans]AMX02100.1 lytic transglycosylase F [Microbulbifer thermotolerans]MCX2778945.1 membrane-bound lytic murein transglycosylase MltF [Microbulbifer thermotolerans]MCX2804250.1 membrane-bound lytic murein transglycosylase MltF [Microbulbifer thermotolerans]MCX2830130.1 membrane-bound lytic murein transglycosylase MltF [Microbulbifer thermotolerans]MCX2835936.1 membrane-bound lytic murein transglycosylase MltF [Microb